MGSWMRDGVAGLQSVVLYSLPELDGAVDTVPLGGLVGDNIYLVPERVHKVAARLKAWVSLRRTPPQVPPVTLFSAMSYSCKGKKKPSTHMRKADALLTFTHVCSSAIYCGWVCILHAIFCLCIFYSVTQRV